MAGRVGGPQATAGLSLNAGEAVPVPLLDNVAQAAERVRAVDREQQQAVDAARDELRAAIRTARDEGLSFAAIGRAAGLSRQRVRQLYAGG
jgi:DNA-directed RNA polymerase specialized sigma24 family protein